MQHQERKERQKCYHLRQEGGHLLAHSKSGELLRRVPVPHTRLSSALRKRLELIWSFLSYLAVKPAVTLEAWIGTFERDLVPERSIFDWENIVFTLMDLMHISNHSDPSSKAWEPFLDLEKPFNFECIWELVKATAHIPIPAADALSQEAVLKLWKEQTQTYRDATFQTVLTVSNGKCSWAEAQTELFVRYVVLAMCRVIRSQAGVDKEVQRIECERYGQALGGVCAGCKKKGDRFKKCGRCEGVYYCSKECQKRAWKTHKMVCVAKE